MEVNEFNFETLTKDMQLLSPIWFKLSEYTRGRICVGMAGTEGVDRIRKSIDGYAFFNGGLDDEYEKLNKQIEKMVGIE